MNKIQPDVDVAPALGWMAQLESRKDVRGKLAHEFGAGAPCNNCDRCTGLDLHFWRKACRICKCRGDQHDCKDDELAGFMQFEILGQKRPEPACKRSKHLNLFLKFFQNLFQSYISTYFQMSVLKLFQSLLELIGYQKYFC